MDKTVDLNTNKWNYMSFKDAKTIKELDQGMDANNNPIYVKNNLEKSIIYFGKPSEFNDKDEFVFELPLNEWVELLIGHDIDADDLNKIRHSKNVFYALKKYNVPCNTKYLNQSNILFKFGRKVANKYKDYYGIFCLAPSPHDKYYWEKYCCQYNGICCEYDINEICKNNKAISHKKVIYSKNKVQYLPEYVNTNLHPEFLSIPLSTSFKNRFGKNPNLGYSAAEKLFSTKGNKWSIEKECRLIMIIKNHKGDNINSREVHAKPIKIFIGYKVSSEIKNYLINFCKERNIEYEIVEKNNNLHKKIM